VQLWEIIGKKSKPEIEECHQKYDALNKSGFVNNFEQKWLTS